MKALIVTTVVTVLLIFASLGHAADHHHNSDNGGSGHRRATQTANSFEHHNSHSGAEQRNGRHKNVHNDNVLINAENYTNTFKSTHVELTDRGCDYVAAFYHLQEAHPHGNIFAIVKGISYDHIRDVVAMPSKSMVMLNYGKHGTDHSKVVHVEDIEELGVRGVSTSPIHVYFPQTTDHEAHDHHHIHDVDDMPNHRVHPNVHINQVPYPHHHPHGCVDDDCDEDAP